MCDLTGQAFLHLQAPSVYLSDARNLGKTNDLAIRNITNMKLVDN